LAAAILPELRGKAKRRRREGSEDWYVEPSTQPIATKIAVAAKDMMRGLRGPMRAKTAKAMAAPSIALRDFFCSHSPKSAIMKPIID
jgi:hypothetical protein